MKGKTKSGFEFEVSKEALDDYELLEDLTDVSEGKEGKIVNVISKMLGNEQKARLKEHLRDESGKVAASKMIQEIKEIFEALKVKN